MTQELYSVKMRASRSGAHVSGAEKIVPSAAVPKTVSALAERALSHSKGAPDFINVKIESAGEITRLESLPVSTNVTHTAADAALSNGCSRLRAASLRNYERAHRGTAPRRSSSYCKFMPLAFRCSDTVCRARNSFSGMPQPTSPISLRASETGSFSTGVPSLTYDAIFSPYRRTRSSL